MYDAWFRIWRDTYVKKDSSLGDPKWTMGIVEDINTYPRYTEQAARKLIKISSVEETNLAEDLPELSKKMKHTRTPDVSSLDLDDITAQVFTAKPRSCKSKKAQQGDCCCEEYCLLTMHHSTQSKLEICEKQTIELVEDHTGQDDGIFQSTCLDVDEALGSTNIS
jgi:hypothetical protein